MPRYVPIADLVVLACALVAAWPVAGCTERARPAERGQSAGLTRPVEREPPDRHDARAAPVAAAASPMDALALAGAAVVLPIPARAHAPEAPAAGWCGETAIQEGLLYLGVWAPQRFINKVGRPAHPDLYSTDIPVALTELGVRHTVYRPSARGYPAFARWVQTALDEGDPVLAGAKILPTAHPEWGLDHFVLAVGHGPRGLLVNTTWGDRQWISDANSRGISFKDAFYAIRLHAFSAPAGTQPARLAARDDGESARLTITCTGLRADTRYQLERRDGADGKLTSTTPIDVGATRMERELTVPAHAHARFVCAPR